MEKLAIQLGKLGSILGALAGIIELSIGTEILPWIGNKENPFVLGVVTLTLSGVAFFSIYSAGKQMLLTNDRKLSIFLGILFPAAICFTTVGRLWYLPGALLMATSFLLAFVYWFRQFDKDYSSNVSRKFHVNQIFGTIGSLLILASFCLAFFIDTFGLFQFEILEKANRIRLLVVPMDIVRLEKFSTNINSIEELEISFVMFVYISLIAGAVIALISSLAGSQLFRAIGGVIVFAGLALFLLEIPAILGQIEASSLKFLDLFGSLGLGWYTSTIGMVLIMISSLSRWKSRI